MILINDRSITSIRQAVTQLLALVCSCDAQLCQRIAGYCKGSVLMALQDILQLPSPSRTEGHDDMLSPIMALRVMHSLIQTITNTHNNENKRMIPESTGCLNYAQLVSFGQASIFCLSELGISETENDGSESKTVSIGAEIRTVSSCCSVLSSLLSVTTSTSVSQKQLTTLHYTVVNGMSSKPAMKAITRLLNSSTNNNLLTQNDIISSSIHSHMSDMGALDGVLALLSASATAQQSAPSSSNKGPSLFLTASLVAKQLQNAGNGEISPLGTLHALRFISSILASTTITSSLLGREQDTNTKNQSLSVLSFANIEGLAVILSFICLPLHLDSCQTWARNQPNNQIDIINGLLGSAGDILKIIMTAISTPPPASPLLSPPGSLSSAAAQDSQKILEGIYRSQLIKCLLQALDSKHVLSGRVIASIVHVLSELVLTSSKFMAQFVECSGLEIVVEVGSNMTAIENTKRDMRSSREKEGSAEEQVAVCMLQISSHLARHSEKHFEILQAIFTPLRIIQLLSQVSYDVIIIIGNSYLHSCHSIYFNQSSYLYLFLSFLIFFYLYFSLFILSLFILNNSSDISSYSVLSSNYNTHYYSFIFNY